MLDELDYTLDTLVHPNTDSNGPAMGEVKPDLLSIWNPYNAHQLVLPLVSRLFSRILVGLPTCRNEEWLNTSVGYTQAVFGLAGDLRRLNPVLRPLVFPFLSSRQRLQKQLVIATEHLLPLLAARASPHRDNEPDLLQWMLDAAQGPDRNPHVLLRKALFLCMASIHTSSTTIVHALFDLCAHPSIAQPLRADIQAAVARTETGTLTLAALNDMPLLDSFLKESQRLNHPGSRAPSPLMPSS